MIKLRYIAVYIPFTDFVNTARQVFAVKLNESHLNTSAFQFAIQDINAMERKVRTKMRDSSQASSAESMIIRES